MEHIREAAAFLEGRVRRTPVEASPGLSERLGAPVYLKLENWQLTGSFKIRGALFGLHRLMLEGHTRIATCSAGNHGRGLARAAQMLGAEATIFVPASVDPAKLAGMQADGATVETSPWPGFDRTEAWAKEVCRERGLPFLSAYDHVDIMAANGGSVALEVDAQLPDGTLTCVMPVGGGGHSAGFARAMQELRPGSQIVAAQAAASPALAQSLEAGSAVTRLDGPGTLAHGLEGGLGAAPFEILRDAVHHVALIDEDAIRGAMRWMAAEHQMMIEASASVAVAACLAGDMPTVAATRGGGKPVVVFISGRNVALETFLEIVDRSGPYPEKSPSSMA
ncbi:MAG: pyridoxal-phosphate dependent enzyme [Rhodothermales bacterium]